MKTAAVCTLSCLILVCICTAINAQGHHVSWGTRIPNDGLLHREVQFSEYKLFRRVEGDYTFDQKVAVGYPKIITMVNVTDQYTNDNGGRATLTSGGPQYQHVKMHFTSKRNRGFNFIIEMYGI